MQLFFFIYLTKIYRGGGKIKSVIAKRKLVRIFRQHFCSKPAARNVSMSLRDEKRVQQRLPRFYESHLHSAEALERKCCLNILQACGFRKDLNE